MNQGRFLEDQPLSVLVSKVNTLLANPPSLLLGLTLTLLGLTAFGLVVWGAQRWRRERSELAKLREQLAAAQHALDRTNTLLNQQQQRFDAVERISQTGSWSQDLASDTLEASAAHRAIFEVAVNDMPRMGLAFVARFVEVPARFPDIQTNLEKLARGEPVEGVREVRLDSGQRKWLRFRSEPVHDAAGVLTGYRGIVRDVTVEHMQSAALDRANNMLLQAQRIAKIGHFEWDLVTDELTFSDRFFETLGFSNEDRFHKMREWRDRFCPVEDQPLFDENAQRVAAGEPYVVIRRARCANGEMHYFKVNAVPVRSANGEVRTYRSTVRNITEEHLSLQRVAKSEERFRRLTEMSSDWYWEQDIDHRFTFLSREQTPASRTPRAEIIGKTRWELFPDALTAAEWRAHQTVLAARAPFSGLVTRIVSPTAAAVVSYFSISGEPMFDLDGVFMGYRGIGKDVTRFKLAENALLEKSAALARLNEQLIAEAQKRRELEGSTMLVVEAALARVGRELHDGLGQNLTGISLLSKVLSSRLGNSDAVSAQDTSTITTLVNQTIGHVRMISHALSPHIAGEYGLQSALRQLATDINDLNVVTCSVVTRGNVVIDDEVATRTLYRIAQESIQHAVQTAGAVSIRISLKVVSGRVQLVVAHDGGAADQQNHPQPKDAAIHRARTIDAHITERVSDRRGRVLRVIWQPTYQKSKPVGSDTSLAGGYAE